MEHWRTPLCYKGLTPVYTYYSTGDGDALIYIGDKMKSIRIAAAASPSPVSTCLSCLTLQVDGGRSIHMPGHELVITCSS